MHTAIRLDDKKLSLWVLAWPLMIEMLLNFFMGIADTLMVSQISDHAVSAVGLSNQVLHSVNVLFITVNAGAGVVIAQKCGAGLWDEARKTVAIAVKANLVIGALLSAIVFFGAEGILNMMNTPQEVMAEATTYLSLVGAVTILVALQAATSAVVRNTGNTRGPMVIAIGMNVIHLFLNYVLIFGAFGFPEMGIVGVAVSTMISRFIALIFNIWLMRKSFEPVLRWLDFKGWDMPIVREVVRIGWPMSITNISWNYTQTVIFAVVATLGAASLTAFTYVSTITGLAHMVGWSIAMAAQIRIAHMYGARRYEEAYQSAYSAWWGGAAYVTIVSIGFYFLGESILRLFTDNAHIIAIALPLFAMNLLLQPLKMMNMAFGTSLIGVGDSRYVAFSSVIFMWLFAAGGSYVFGHTLAWGVIGVYAAMTLDEAARGVIVCLRWRRRLFIPGARLKATTPS